MSTTEQLAGAFQPIQRDYIAAAIEEALAPLIARAAAEDAQFDALLAEVRGTLSNIDERVNDRMSAIGVDPRAPE